LEKKQQQQLEIGIFQETCSPGFISPLGSQKGVSELRAKKSRDPGLQDGKIWGSRRLPSKLHLAKIGILSECQVEKGFGLGLWAP